jgi:Tfp pilus assembly major pilin PilA
MNIKKLLLIITTLALTPEVLAIDMEYYSPNGMSTVADAFHRMALIFSDNSYQVLFFSIAVLGAMLAFGYGVAIKPIITGNINQVDGTSWIGAFLIGTVLYFGAFIPKATIHVYDPVKNDTQSVAGVPQIIVLVAGLTNLVERTMIDITNTGSAYPYNENANGVNIELFLNAIQVANYSSQRYLDKDIQAYKKACGDLSMATHSTQNDKLLYSGSTSQYNMLASWVNNAQTVGIHEGNANINYMTCTDAWNNYLKTALLPANMNQEVNIACAKSGFDNSKAVQKQKCEDLLGNAAKLHGLTSATAGEYMREAFIARSLLKSINSDNPTQAQIDLIGRQITLQGVGSLNAAEETQPQLRAMMTAIILGLIPFLTLFIVTPLWSKALKFMAGSFLWITTWGIMSAVTHVGIMDSALTALSSIEEHKLGLQAFMLAETDGVRAFMMFGKMQSNSIVMATIVVGIFGFGSYAMTGLAQGMSNNMSSLGEKAAQQTMTPEGRMQLRNQLTQGMASDGAVASSLGSNVPTITNTGSEYQATNAAANVGTQLGQSSAYTNAATQANTSVQGVGEVKGETTQTQSIADSQALQTTQNNLGGGDALGGATIKAESDQGKVVGDINKAQNIANAIGIDNTPTNIGSIQSNLAENSGSFAMSGKDIMNSDFANTLSQAHKDNITDGGNYAFSNMKFDESGNLTTANVSAGGVAFRQDDSITTTSLETHNNQNLAPLGKLADAMNKGYELNGTDINGNIVNSDGNIMMGKNEGQQGEFFTAKGLAQSITDNGGLVIDNKDLLNTPNITKLIGEDGVSQLRENPTGAMNVSNFKFSNDGGLQSFDIDKSANTRLSNNVSDSATTSITRGFSDKVETDAATIGTALQDIKNGDNNTVAATGFDKLVDQSTRGDENFNEQARRTLENQGANWFKSNGVDFTESVQDSSSFGTSEKAEWDSNKSVLGRAFAKTTGVSGSVGTNASQSTASTEDMRFNSMNDVMSKFIDHANGDSAKLAAYMNDFDKHVRGLRAENTESNTITNNINNDADDIINKKK